MRGLAVDGAALFQEHLSNVADGFRQQIAPLILRSEENKIDETFANFRDQFREIDWFLPFDVSLYDFIYFAVQALGFALWHASSPSNFRESPGLDRAHVAGQHTIACD
jgi:hypothetical protein